MYCAYCSEQTKRDANWKFQKYCSNQCQKDKEFRDSLFAFLRGEVVSRQRRTLKRLVIARDGEACAECGLVSWNDREISLELDHIDGNGENDSGHNLRLLCPNCHSQTPTYKARNKGNGRVSRRKLAA